MKKTFIILIVVLMTLTLFMGSALADKPEGKPGKPEQTEEPEGEEPEGEEPEGEEPEGEEPEGEEPEGEEGPKKPNEKRDAKMLFREETRPLIDEVHANREEWGALGEASGDLGDLIDAQIDALIAGGAELSPEQIALIKAKIVEIRALKVQMRDFNRVVHSNWKQYIAAKKESDVEAGTLALNNLIAIQELRIEIRGQIITIMNELAAALTPSVPEVPAA